MLARSVRPYTPLLVPVRFKNNYAESHPISRQISTIKSHKANPSVVKAIEATIRRINNDPSFSAEYKFRNSHRLFAQLDYYIVVTEVRAAARKFNQVRPYLPEVLVDESNPNRVPITNALIELRIGHRRLATARWNAVKLNVFAPRGDVHPVLRLTWVLRFFPAVVIGSVQRICIYILASHLRCL